MRGLAGTPPPLDGVGKWNVYQQMREYCMQNVRLLYKVWTEFRSQIMKVTRVDGSDEQHEQAGEQQCEECEAEPMQKPTPLLLSLDLGPNNLGYAVLRADGGVVALDAYSWEQAEERPLAFVFKEELQRLLHRVQSVDWCNSGAFLWFRLTESDLDAEVCDRRVGMLVYDRSSVDWVHLRLGGFDEAYDNGEEADVDLDDFGLQSPRTLWQSSNDAHVTFTQHLPLHERWGRPVITMEELLSADGEGF